MAKQEKVQVDEDFMKEIISQGLPVKQEIPASFGTLTAVSFRCTATWCWE